MQGLFEQRLELCGVVRAAGRDMEQGQPGGLEDAVDKAVACLAAGPLVVAVVQLAGKARLHGLRLADQEVHVFAVDPVVRARILVRAGDKEDIC